MLCFSVFLFVFFFFSFLSLDRIQQLLSLKPILIKKQKTKNDEAINKRRKKNSGRLLIILAGYVVSLALFLIIIHELCIYRCISNPIGVHHVANDIYEDIAAANVQRILRCLWYQNNCTTFLESLRDWSRSYLYI